MKPQWDLILVGGGLANGLIAWRLRQLQPQLKMLLLEAGAEPGGNQTWSFHQDDLTPAQHAWIAPLVAHRWSGYDVRFPALTRRLDGGYLSITSGRFAAVIAEALGDSLRTRTPVSALTPETVTLADGSLLRASAVIDGRGYQPGAHLTIGFQAFLGQQWRLSQPHGLTRPLLMDATVDQSAGYRFVYTLPLSADSLLIEDTHYIIAPRSAMTGRASISPTTRRRRAGRWRGWSARSRATCRSRWRATAAPSGSRKQASPVADCAPGCSTPPPATPCRRRRRWPILLPGSAISRRARCSP